VWLTNAQRNATIANIEALIAQMNYLMGWDHRMGRNSNISRRDINVLKKAALLTLLFLSRDDSGHSGQARKSVPRRVPSPLFHSGRLGTRQAARRSGSTWLARAR
jgi:hypothetical protein